MTIRTRRSWLWTACMVLGACATAQHTPSSGARQVRLAMAEEMGARGDWASAFQAADALTREDPDDLAARLVRAKALRHQGMYAEAEADLDLVLAASPRNAEAHSELALVCENQHRPEALEHHQKASTLAPDDPRYANNLGFALLARGRARDAIPLFEKALRAEPRSARLRNNLGFAYAAAGDFTRAAQQFDLAGPPAMAKNNLAYAYERRGDLAQAFDLYLEAWRLDRSTLARNNLENVARKLARDLPLEVTAPRAATTQGGS